MPLKVKLLNPLATAPTIAHPSEDLGYDIYALRIQGQPINLDGTPVQWVPARPGMPTRIDTNGKIVHPIRIEAGRPLILDTGISAYYESTNEKTNFGLLVRDRSSLASKGIFITAGVIDSGYRGEIKIILNLAMGSYADLWPGNKIAQLIPIPIYADQVEIVKELEESARQEGGFGSTGT